MELIRIERRPVPSSRRTYFRNVGIFRCPQCDQLVERKVSIGLALKRCGCVPNNYKHGLKHHPLYKIWKHIRERCNNPNYPEFHLYGGRGISICPEWDDAKAFVAWGMANGYGIGLQIDRRKNSEGYSPDNCRFVTPAINSQNSRLNKLTANKVREIRRRVAAGERQASLAREFRVNKTTINMVVRRLTWRNIR